MTAPLASAMATIPAAWASLPPNVQAEIGILAIREALLWFAADEFKGDEPGTSIAYLDLDDRDAADQDAREANDSMRALLGDHMPDLFGSNPTDESPNGTDPAWATAIVRPFVDREAETIFVAEGGAAASRPFARADALELAGDCLGELVGIGCTLGNATDKVTRSPRDALADLIEARVAGR